MGQIVRQKIPALFNGVSRQPPSVRLSSQVSEAENVTFSVVTGGFSSRPGLERVGKLTSSPLQSPAVYSYRRSEDEAYFVAVTQDGQLHVWDKTGQAKNILYGVNSQDYLQGLTGPEDVAFATLADTTLILNKTVETQMDPSSRSPVPAYSYGTVLFLEYVREATYWVQVDYKSSDPNQSGSFIRSLSEGSDDLNYDSGRGARIMAKRLAEKIPNGNWIIEASGSFVFIRGADGNGNPYEEFSVTVRDTRGGGTMKVASDYAKEPDDLPAQAWNGMVCRIGGRNEDDGNQYFVFNLSADSGTRFPDRRVTFTGDGTTTAFDIGFEFKNQAFITITVNGTDPGGYSLVEGVDGSYTLVFDTAPAADDEIVVTYEDPESGTSYGDGYWEEAPKPGSAWQFDASTMPHLLLRKADGNFVFGPADGTILGSDDKPIEWNRRETGDSTSTPNPDFVGQRISGIGFHRSRLYFLSEQSVIFGQAGDYFNFWPDTAAEVIDSDPFSRIAGSQQVRTLKQAYPFRKALVVSADTGQYEVASPQALTPDSATIDASTNYTIEPKCPPVAIGPEVYFAARNGTSADVLEYSYDDNSLSNTAERIAIHVADYIPSPIIEMATDPTTGALFARTPSDPSALYVYRLHWQGRKKVQSAWGRWSTRGIIQSVQVFDGYVWVVRQIDGKSYLERAPLNDNAGIDGLPYPARLDGWMGVTGQYDPTTGLTSWDVGDAGYDSPVGVMGQGFPDPMIGRFLTVQGSAPDTVVTAQGNYTAGELFIGERFESRVELSPQYLRERDDSVKTDGRLQLRTITFHYVDTGGFDVRITPNRRRSRIKRASTAGEGRPGFQLDKPAELNKGSVTARVRTRAETATIEILSNSETPFTVTSADWLGFYNEVSQ